jgi:endonuclease/exonuclease/phosphatase family metal-dependent hydrolase
MPTRPSGTATNISQRIDSVVDKKYRGTDRYLDLVTWNIRWFHHRDPNRLKNVTEVLKLLNADIIVLQEIKEGSLGPVSDALEKAKAGNYEIAYGTTGGDQRVAIMWDLDWIRAKDNVGDLEGTDVKVGNKKAFPRRPVWGYFTGLTKGDPFDFQLVGVHLKAQAQGGDDEQQRLRSAEWIAEWLEGPSKDVDSDVIVVGDWNQPPTAPAWQPIHELEAEGKVWFTKINNGDSISHLFYKRKEEIGSRLDIKLLSSAAKPNLKGNPECVLWKDLAALLGSGAKAKDIQTYIQKVSNNLSDHMPVVSRYFFREKQPAKLEIKTVPVSGVAPTPERVAKSELEGS